jgi:exonuclease III
MNRSIQVCSWNVRGLNDSIKCGNILSELLSASPYIVLVQETKLNTIPSLKLHSFIPRRLDSFLFNPADGTSGGVLTAWNSLNFHSARSLTTQHTLTICFTSTASNLTFYVTNVYAPSTHELLSSFLDELKSIPLNLDPDTPWLIFGDFNMIRYPHEKNNANFHQAEADAFNDCIHSLCLIDLPLIGRQFTWTSKRTIPTLERLDRGFINLAWDKSLPNTILTPLTRRTSDHVPLVVTAATQIPKSKLFRFENYWINQAGFREIVQSAWCCRTVNSDSAGLLAAKLKETRRGLKNWSKQHSNMYQQESDCRLVINLLDHIEEQRSLSISESKLRVVITKVLSRTAQAKLLLWRQRAKIKVAVEGDENTRFFHACANQRRRQNKIQVIEHESVELYDHERKAAVLHGFYSGLLGSNPQTEWSFRLNDLYPEGPISLSNLENGFEHEEIHAAFKHMKPNASPGPDGFGPLFFKKMWHIVAPDIVNFFAAFNSQTSDLARINRSYLVLLPKKEGAKRPQEFRPIALQNTVVKAVSRVLMQRLQPLIPHLIGTDQSGFVQGRCIADNFVYAADLLSCCHRRRCPTIILKLDFHKAFDCVDWESLHIIMRHRGFPEKRNTWIMNILQTGKTAVLLNGDPGKWINCKRGLRQGDPLSPYLFIIVADVLCRLLHFHPAAADIRHPIIHDQPCPVLQYADDTLIFLRCTPQAIAATKQILQLFEKATGLAINYHKTTFLPIAVPDHEECELASVFGATTSTFPQTYLGLPPLSP